MITKDVLVVGGGPAGSSCAWRLHQQGLNCLILDKASFPRQKPCAGWVTPELLQSLEITPTEYPHGMIEFSTFQITVGKIKFRISTQQYAIRRWEFDAWLLQRAQVDTVVHHVRHIEQVDGSYVVDGTYTAKYLIGAGGTHCPVRRSLFANQQTVRKTGLIIAKEEEFPYPVEDNRCHLWFFQNGLPGYAWYVPKANGYLNVGIGGSASRLQAKGETLNQHWDRLVEHLAEQGLVRDHEFTPLGHSYNLRQRKPQLQNGNAFLVGDSLGLATVDMGEGIGPAIQSGLLAAEAILNNQPYSIKGIPRYSFPSILGLRR